VCEDDEDILAGRLLLARLLEGFLDLSVVHVEVSTQYAPEDTLEGGHSSTIDCTGDELEVKGAKGAVLTSATTVVVALYVIQQRGVGIICAIATIAALPVLGLIEEDGRLAEDMTGFLELQQTLLKRVVAVVHLTDAIFVISQLGAQFLHLQRSSTRSAFGEVEEGQGRLEGTDRDLLGLHLGLQEADSAVHLVKAADVGDEGTLERSDVRVEL
jgi:hypothetical protein